MADEHERIEELLAAYVLRSLSGPDAEEADRLLSDHVPSCPLCRETLEGFQSVAGELALRPAPAPPPSLLLPRIRRAMSDVPVIRRRRVSLIAAAASVAALVGMAGLTVSFGSRVTRAEARAGVLRNAIGAMSQAGSSPVSLRSESAQTSSGMVEISGPTLERMYLVGSDVAPPAPGYVYRLWLGSGGRFTFVHEFIPEGGWVALELTIDPGRYDELLITEELQGSPHAQPAGARRWNAAL